MRLAGAALLVGLCVAGTAAALEVDPYLAWLEEIPDSAPALNEYTTYMISGHLQRLAEEGAASGECSPVAISALRHLHHTVLTRRRALAFLKRSPEVTIWKPGGPWSSVWRSYYRRLPPLYVSSLAGTVDLNGIRMSVDKVGHFFSFGRRYYRRYLKALARGEAPREAERAAILWGLKQENLFVGKWIDTIFSHADLEANYQGFRFARDLCGGQRPYLVRRDGAWALGRDVDLRPYLTPDLDEGYNNNHFTRLGWWLVRGRLRRHCPVLEEPRVRERLRYYDGFGPPSVSKAVIAEHFAARGRSPQRRHSLQTVCSEAGLQAAAGG